MSILKIFTIVHQQTASIIERFGKYHKTLNPGLHFIIPIMDRIAYRHSLKEETITIDNQTVITKDNVTVHIDGSLFVKIFDPYKASYKVERPLEAIRLLALTVLRSEIGKIKLDQVFQERQGLNVAINKAVNLACEDWGLTCIRYEILNIEPPQEIKTSMQYEAEAERLKRREILISEGKQQAEINISTGKKISLIKQAEGEAKSLELISEKEAESLKIIASALKQKDSKNIMQFILLQNYISNFENTLKKSNVVVTPEGGKMTGTGKKDGNSNDFLTLAAMMMLNTQNSMQYNNWKDLANNKIDLSKFSDKMIGVDKKKFDDEHLMGGDSYEQMMKKMEYYDDPILYGSDDEQQKKSGFKPSIDKEEKINKDQPESQNPNLTMLK